jgi:hypothetical protein
MSSDELTVLISFLVGLAFLSLYIGWHSYQHPVCPECKNNEHTKRIDIDTLECGKCGKKRINQKSPGII